MLSDYNREVCCRGVLVLWGLREGLAQPNTGSEMRLRMETLELDQGGWVHVGSCMCAADPAGCLCRAQVWSGVALPCSSQAGVAAVDWTSLCPGRGVRGESESDGEPPNLLRKTPRKPLLVAEWDRGYLDDKENSIGTLN